MACLFCKIIAGELPSDIVYENDEILAFKDVSPQAPLHYLIIPRQHIASTNELDSEHALLVGNMLITAKQLAHKAGVADDGYRLVFNCNEYGGQTVHHLHLHLLAGRVLNWPPG